MAGVAAFALAVAVDAVPEGFQREYFYGGGTGTNNLVYPTNLEFAPDGSTRFFVTEKRGVIKTASAPGVPMSVVADMKSVTHSFWDRGMLGLAVHPDYPETPYLYVLYAHGTPLPVPGWPPPRAEWEDGPSANEDECPNPPGSTTDGCVVSAQLARITVDLGDLPVGPDDIEVLIHDWCQQFPSHSVGDLVFGADGALYISAGDGASFGGVADFGQFGGSLGSPTPSNPCGDPPSGAGGVMSAGTAEGGALRAQDLLTDGDAVGASGAILRINPLANPDVPSSLVMPGNPNASHSDPIGKLIVAHGLRNPYRMTVRPNTSQLYIGDVGYETWEEVNRILSPTAGVLNFGWPCYEGGSGSSLELATYSTVGMCQDLINLGSGAVTAPFFAYRHNQDIEHPDDDVCPPAETGQMSRTSSSTTGLAFYPGGLYPGFYNGALFGADYSRGCIWVMSAGQNGHPDPASVQVFHYEPTTGTGPGRIEGITPVDLEMGPDGAIYGVSHMRGQLFRFNWLGTNDAPVADITVSNTGDPFEFVLDATGSSDPDGQPITYAWDLDNDGLFDDSTEPTVTRAFAPGQHTVRLRVTDFPGASDIAMETLQVNNTKPVATISSPTSSLTWSVGDSIDFSGTGSDAEDGTLPGEQLHWALILHHCAEDGTCHEHHDLGSRTGASGSFDAPDHPYPTWLEIRLSVEDQFGATGTDSVLIYPKTVDLTIASQPSGLDFGVGTTPYTTEVIVNSRVALAAPESAVFGGWPFEFSHWVHGGARTQDLLAPATDTTYTAVYQLTDLFVDDDNSIFEEDIEWLAVAEITRGCNPPANDRYCPDDHVTRGQMAAFFVRALDLPAGPGDQFDDDDGHLFEAEIDRLANSGITRGCNPPANTRFCPDDFVTRGQMAAFFVRAFGLDEGASDNLFVDDNGHLFEAEINMLATAGITRGCNPPTNDRFCPESFVTRGQMAAFFHRAAAWLP